jgi:hypothetical protein
VFRTVFVFVQAVFTKELSIQVARSGATPTDRAL